MLADLRQRLLDRLLGTGVDVCRRLIQNQYLRGVHQHASQRQQLLLPDGEIIALLAQLGVQPIAHAARHRRQLHRLQRFPNLRLTDVPAQRDVGVKVSASTTGSCCTIAMPRRNALWLRDASGRPSMRISPWVNG